jgi:hypothetical protein
MADRAPARLKEKQMIKVRILAITILGAVLSAPSIYSQDLSRYREFQFGTSLPAIAKQANLKPLDAKAIHQRPAVIQELTWEAQSFPSSSSASDSVKNILFSFYNGELFRMVITYDQDRIAGLTAEDIIEAVSAKYGPGARPVAEIILSSTNFYNDGEKIISDQSVKVLARWEDSQYSFNLYQSSYPSTFGMVMYSKRLDALARTAIAKAVHLDDQEAPQRETERQNKKDEEKRALQEKARAANRAAFRP